jgi:hypothetical protein
MWRTLFGILDSKLEGSFKSTGVGTEAICACEAGWLGCERLEPTCRYYPRLVGEQDLEKAHERFLEL